MIVEPSIAKAYWARIHNSRRSKGKDRYWGFPCDARLLDFKLKFFNGREVVIPGRFMNAGRLNGGAPKPREFGFLTLSLWRDPH